MTEEPSDNNFFPDCALGLNAAHSASRTGRYKAESIKAEIQYVVNCGFELAESGKAQGHSIYTVRVISSSARECSISPAKIYTLHITALPIYTASFHISPLICSVETLN